MKRVDIKYDLSIGMIVKNEEKYLEDCLKALLPLKNEISYELIITDTGSTDKTVEIAQKYADKVLHFEWCDDFSVARNTGVESCNGKWFLYVDADEIFDESVMEIAKFIKSKDSDNYDSARIIMKNIKSLVDVNVFDVFYPSKLFNFNKEKRFFTNTIHETIIRYGSIFNIEASFNHYGYLNEVVEQKKERNLILMRKELEQAPNDFRLIKHLIDSEEYSQKITLAKTAFDIVKNTSRNNYEHIEYAQYYLSIYCCLSFAHYNEKQYNLLIELCEEYFNNEYVSLFRPIDNMATMEMYYLYGEALYNVENYELALEKILKYQEMYPKTLNHQNDILKSAHSFITNNNKVIKNSQIIILNCYDKLNDNKNLLEVLSKYEIYDDNTKICVNFHEYIEFIIKYKHIDLLDKVINTIKETEDESSLYNNYPILLYASMLLDKDITNYLKNCFSNTLNNHIFITFNKKDLASLNNIYEVISKKLEYINLKDLLMYLNLMRLYIINMCNFLYNENQKDLIDDNYRKLLNDVFENYIESMSYYVKSIYNNQILESDELDLLSPFESFAFIVSPALEKKESQPVEYIKSLKTALEYNSHFKDVVANAVHIVQKNIDQTNQLTSSSDKEFQILSEKIKLTITQSIQANELEKAKLIIQQYKEINPTDPDIEKFVKLMI